MAPVTTSRAGRVGRVWRWIEEPAPVDPIENMARDAILLEEMLASAYLPAVRVYRWSTAAVTVGRLQNEDDVRARFPGMTLVRRPTGGRAVVHGDDLTVSVATRDEFLPEGTGGAVMSSYQVIVTGIIEALRQHGIDALAGKTRSDGTAGRFIVAKTTGQSFDGGFSKREIDRVDCFAAVASCDIAESGTGQKLVGSAQRRDRGAILQQMSIHRDVVYRLKSIETFVADLQDSMMQALDVSEWRIEKQL